MTKILLLSDTHGYIDDTILKHAGEADEIWHAGDIGSFEVTDKLSSLKPFRAVYGNIDGGDLRIAFPEHQKFTCEKINVWITHIGGYPNRYEPRVKEQLFANPPHLFICGHSHILKVMRDEKLNNMLHINPGAAGRHGMHIMRTMVKFKIEDSRIFDLEIIELGRRGKID